jgi:hypothetical protein
LLTFFYTVLIAKGEGETLTRSIEKSLRRGSSSLNLSKGRTRKEMEENLIIVDELYISKKVVVGARTPAGNEAWSQADLTPPKVIVGVVTCHYLGIYLFPSKV